MWDNLLRVDWDRLKHAYGWAWDVPSMLRGMIADDEKVRVKAWGDFEAEVNHQGDFYDSTVAAVPFLIEAAANPDTPDRVAILDYCRDRWVDAPRYGGDALVPDPPGGVDHPTPFLDDQAFATQQSSGASARDHQGKEKSQQEDQEEGEEFDVEAYRRTDLCAWQTGRAIKAGQAVFERLLDDPDRAVAAAAAMLLLIWPQTRGAAKRALIRTIADEPDPSAQTQRILEFGVYAANGDDDTLLRWLAPEHPSTVRTAAALVLAWVADPSPPAKPAAAVLEMASQRDSDGFAGLPWVGVFQRGPWIMPANAASLILRLAESDHKELRWRAVQGLSLKHATAQHLSPAQVVPVLLQRLSDDYNRIRAAAAFALAQRGEEVLNVAPDAAPVLIGALDGHRSRDWGDPHHGLDSDASICGHAARLLAVLSPRLTTLQRRLALTKVEQAMKRYAGQPEAYVSFDTMSVPASSSLQEPRDRLAHPRDWQFADLLAACAIPVSQEQLSPPDSDRRLAEAYARQPDQVIVAASEAVRTGGRWAVMGAAQWLATLGPAAEKALPALDAIAGGPLDSHAQDQVSRASKFIRQSLILVREGDQVASSARADVAELLSAAAEANIADERRHDLIVAFTEHLNHADAVVRAGAAEGLALLSPSLEEAASAIPLLERMLDDEAFVEIGIAGPRDCGGRLVHWRHQRCSPRRAAVQALSALGRVPPGDRLLAAMLAEAAHALAICNTLAEPPRFAIAQWRAAVEAAGGLMFAEPRIRAARQQCLCEPWTGHTGPQVCEAELAEVIRVLSGRLAP
jgi:hypothetical protein